MPFKQNISKVNINITERRYHVVLSALLYDRKYNMSTYVSKPTFNIILDFVLVGLYFGSYMGLY